MFSILWRRNREKMSGYSKQGVDGKWTHPPWRVSELLKAGIWCYQNTHRSQSGLWQLEHNGGVGMLECLRREWLWRDEWKAAAVYINRLLERMSEDHTVMHVVSLYGNAKWCSPWGCPYFSLEAWPTCLLQTWLYRRLLYFANLLLCSAAILKRSKRKRGVDREITESSCKETDEQERGGWVTSSTATIKGCWKRTDTVLPPALWGL